MTLTQHTPINPAMAQWLEDNYDWVMGWVTTRERQRQDLIDLLEDGASLQEMLSFTEFVRNIDRY